MYLLLRFGFKNKNEGHVLVFIQLYLPCKFCGFFACLSEKQPQSGVIFALLRSHKHFQAGSVNVYPPPSILRSVRHFSGISAHLLELPGCEAELQVYVFVCEWSVDFLRWLNGCISEQTW
jgi:hypothetical protein